MRMFAGFLSGLVFGIGLLMSGMANPAKVLNFLDVFGTWDPSLAFVMGGASVVAFVGYRLVWRRDAPMLDARFDLPKRTSVDPALLTGSAIFGIGWGIGGFCPGPAFTAIAFGAPGTMVFVATMLVGILLGQRFRAGRMTRATT